jgi:hypothetical protein
LIFVCAPSKFQSTPSICYSFILIGPCSFDYYLFCLE